MGLFDRLGRLFGSEAAPPAKREAPPLPPAPTLPARGRIASLDTHDGVGTITLADGGEIRFGRTACKGFEPVVGATVVVEELAPGPKGHRAKVLRLADEAGDYASLLAARDAAHGLRTGPMTNEEAAATALTLGVATVLLRDPLPLGQAQLRAWADALGLPTAEIAVAFVPELAFSLPGGMSLTYPGRGPFPRAELDARSVDEGFDFGASFVGLGTGLRDVDRQLRILHGRLPDAWDEAGKMRKLAGLILRLAPAATGVVLHRAGNLVVDIETFVSMHGDLDDPACVPFAAWLDTALTTRSGGRRYGTFGMDAFGLPDVFVPVDADDAYDRGRAHEAALFACYTMVRENRELATGEVVRVPVRVRIGAFPLAPRASSTRDYTVVEDGSHLGLAPIAPRDDRATWREEGIAIEPAIYQALFDHGLDAALPSDIIRDVEANQGDPPHRIEVRARRDGHGYLTVTNGFGRAPHALVHREDCTHFELGAWSEDHAFELLRLVGVLAGDAQGSPAGGWKPGDTLATPLPPLGIGGFLLADGGGIEMGSGPSVRLLLLVPLSPEDYAQARGGNGLAWLAAHPIDETTWRPFMPRG